MRPKKPYSQQSRSNREALRKKAVRQRIEKNRSISEIAQELGVSRQTVYNWLAAHEQDPDHGLDTCPRGPDCALTPEDCDQLSTLLLQGARAHGWPNDLWTIPRIVELVDAHFGVRYTDSGMWHVLTRELGFSWQKPERRARERDDEAIQLWKTETFPRLKKKGGP
jgi:transposase